MQPVRFCRNCGAGVSGGAFCTSCGTRLAAEEESQASQFRSDTRSRLSGGVRDVVSAREALFGAVSGAIGVAGMLAIVYLSLSLVWVFGGTAPGARGLVGFVLLHGGGADVEVPPIEALFGIGGSFAVDPPLTSLALLPFLVFLLLGWMNARRESVSWGFVGSASLVYGVLLALLSLIASASVEVSPSVTANISASPVSAGIWGFLLAGAGAALGVSGARGPLLGEDARRVVTGGFVALGTSVGVAVALAVILSLVSGAGEGSGASQPGLGQEFGTPSLGATTGGDLASLGALVGGIFALLPAAVGGLWLLANGIPIGFQNAPDLSSIPVVGEALQGIPLKLGLLGEWPLGGEWRLLLAAPIAGLLLGGFVAGRGASNSLIRGALVAVPYALMAVLIIALTRASAGVSVAAVNVDVSFGASYAWTLLLVPVGALFGAMGGFLGKSGMVPASRPMRAMTISGVAGLVVLLLTLPVFLAPFSSASGSATNTPVADTSPTPDFAFEESMPKTPDDPAEVSAPEFSSEPLSEESDTEEVSTGDAPDPAFDAILPTLRGMTTAEVMLPAELPGELEDVAVDSVTGGEEYGILFLAEPPNSTVEDFVRASTLGTLSSGPDLPDVEEQYFTSSNEETVELPDGTPAALRYLEPVGMSNASPFWEGRFERNGQEYLLNLPYADLSGEIARGLLTSMVPAGEAAASGEQVEQQFISGYYEAVGRRDWAATYSMLDAATRGLYTEDEWVYAQEARENASGSAPVTGATITDISGEGASFTATVDLEYADGTSATLPGIEVYYEGGEFRRHLTDEELEFLEQY